MDLDFLIMSGYGKFVWPAFFVTFVCLFSLYLKTRKELVKNEKKFFIEFEQLPVANIKVKQKETSREVLSGSRGI